MKLIQATGLSVGLGLLCFAIGLVPVVAQQAAAPAPQPSIEELMVSQTGTVLGILRTWHNQISADQETISRLQGELAKVTKERDEAKGAGK